MVKFPDTQASARRALGSPVEIGLYSNSSERGMSVASAEMHYLSTARWLSVLLVTALSLLTPVSAQEGVPADGAVQGGGSDEEGSQGEASTDPAERFFIRTTGDSGMLAQLYPHLAVWLEPEGAPRVLALVEREATSAPKGAVVVLADEGQTANEPLLEGIRRRLTKAGWATMTLGNDQVGPSLQLARQRMAGVDGAAAGDSSGQNETVMIDVNDQAAEDLLQAHREEMNARLASAVAWFLERDYSQVILVGTGRGAVVVNEYLPAAPETVTRVAWVAPEFEGLAPGELAASLGGLPVEFLDLYPSRSSGGAERGAAFRRAGITGYKALGIPLTGGPRALHSRAIASRLAGWASGD